MTSHTCELSWLRPGGLLGHSIIVIGMIVIGLILPVRLAKRKKIPLQFIFVKKKERKGSRLESVAHGIVVRGHRSLPLEDELRSK